MDLTLKTLDSELLELSGSLTNTLIKIINMPPISVTKIQLKQLLNKLPNY